MNGSRSREALLEFLEYLARKGMINKTTASARKAAVNNVLGVLDNVEASDVAVLDLDDVMRRFHNIHGQKYTPDSLNTYKSRVKSSIDDFLSYVDNPMGFKPALAGNGRKAAERSKLSTSKSSKSDTSSVSGTPKHDGGPAPFGAPIILPIPLRIDLTVYVQGLPYNLTQAEASKIANVIKAMAIDE